MAERLARCRQRAHDLVRREQRFSHYASGAIKDVFHPEAGKRYATWKRADDGLPSEFWDEDLNVTSLVRDGLRRIEQTWFAVGNEQRDSWTASSGHLSYAYEPGQDVLKRVHSSSLSRNLVEYVHDDFGRLLWVTAPSTMVGGAFTYAYDARGNVVQRSGGGTLVTYRYDGLDRLTRLTASRALDGSQIEYVYSYDDPSARGRLHSIAEPDRTTTFTWDEVGRIRFEEVAEAGVSATLTTEYRYDADGDLSDVIAASGLHVRYDRDPVTKDVTEVRNLATGLRYASDVRHLPGGPITDLTFAGGATLSQGFNRRYEPIAISSGPLALSYEMTGAGNVKTIGPTTYRYDVARRLVGVTPATGSARYSFGLVGDRVTEASSIETYPKRKFAFGYDDASSLSAVSTYDAAGTSITGTTCFVHDALGRVTAVGPALARTGPDARACRAESDLSSVAVRFRYDARNRRVARRDGSGPWKYWVFTADGNPLAELRMPASSGDTWTRERDYVWLDGRPLAQVEYPGPAGSSDGYVYLMHVDHLGQPRALTSTAGAVVWRASPARPYGEVVEAKTPDPANGRTIVTNLRLPGQYDERLLGSVGLQGPYYNWNRWYLPSVGRYLELDPIATAGGLNTPYRVDWYGYAVQNPLAWVDPLGLYPGQMPPLPPGYSWSTWRAIEFDTGWALEAPDGRRFFAHPEDKGHWRHWDIQKPGGGSGGRWPWNSLKPWPGQKKLKKNQCTTDPSGDTPGWEPPPRNPLYEGGAPDAPFTPLLPLPGPVPMPAPMPMPTPVPVW